MSDTANLFCLNQAQPISHKELQLVGVTAMLLAAKYEEIHAPSIVDFVYITDTAYTSAQIRAMEQKILKELDFFLGRPLALHFLRRAAKVCEVGLYSSPCGVWMELDAELCADRCRLLETRSPRAGNVAWKLSCCPA